jgi:hypothetical protein
LLERCFFGQKLRAFSTDGMATVEVQHPCTALDHEGVDLGVVIGMKGEDSPQDVAKDHVDGTLTTVVLLFGLLVHGQLWLFCWPMNYLRFFFSSSFKRALQK